jgi:hypothetical protein
LVRAGAVEGIGLLVVNAEGFVLRVQRIPVAGFISLNDGTRSDNGLYKGNAFRFGFLDRRNGAAVAWQTFILFLTWDFSLRF